MSDDVSLPGRRKVDALCLRCGITPNILRSYMRGARVPSAWVAAEIAQTLGRDVGDLFPKLERAIQSGPDVHHRSAS